MKKFIYSLAAATLLTLSGCSEEGLVSENDGQVTFSVSLPDKMESRAYSDGETADKLEYAVYEAEGTNAGKVVFTSTVTADPQATLTSARNFELKMNLVKGKSYDVIFWAHKSGNTYYTFSATDKNVSISYSSALEGNDEGRDAFFQVVKGMNITGPTTKSVELRRPFAQLNVGTSDLTDAKNQGTTVASTSVTVKEVYSKLNLFTGIASDPKELTFTATGVPTGETFPYSENGKTYEYLSMNYILTGSELEADDVQKAQREVKDVKFVMTYENGQTETIEMTAVPFQRNYRTNIYGSLILAPTIFNIVIDQEYYDGTNVTTDPSEPAKDPADANKYLIKTQGELTWISDQLKDGNNLEGKTFELQNDIYLVGEWTPIGGGGLDFGKRFSGVFEGNGHTIHNMVVDASEKAGFFGFINGRVQNLNFENAKVSAYHWAGVVAGYSDNETGQEIVKNCTVKNSTVTIKAENLGSEWDNGDKADAIIGYIASRDIVDGCSVENVTIQGYRDLGSVVGMSNGAVIKNCTASGVNIYVDNSQNYKIYADLAKHNCGEIVGRNDGTITDCSANDITIEMLVANGVTMNAAGEYLISAPAGLVWMSDQVNAMAINRFSGKTVKLACDIDMTGVDYTPCGDVNAYPSKTFAGTFDGDNHIISNLTTSSIGQGGNAAAGLFGSSVGVIKNVTLKDVDIKSTHYAGAVVAYSSSNVGFKLENCHVDGGKVVSAAENTASGYDNGDKVGGLIGYTVVGDQILNCSVKNITVQGYRDLGGLIGAAAATVKNNTIENVKVIIDNTQNYKNYTTQDDHNVGEIIGRKLSGLSEDNNTSSNVTISEIN